MSNMTTITVVPRRDTNKNWCKQNPVLDDKEFVIVHIGKYLRLYKLGDGVRTYKKLPFRSWKYCLENGYFYGTVKHIPNKIVQLVINWKEN